MWGNMSVAEIWKQGREGGGNTYDLSVRCLFVRGNNNRMIKAKINLHKRYDVSCGSCCDCSCTHFQTKSDPHRGKKLKHFSK